MARSRFEISAGHSVTAWPSTHETIWSLESSFSGATSPASARAAAAAHSGFSVDGAPPHAERTAATAMTDRLRGTSMTSCDGPEARCRAGIREAQGECRRVEVLVVELQPPEAPLERERWLAGPGLGPLEVLKPEQRDHRLDDDHRRDVLAEAGVPIPPVVGSVRAAGPG